MAVQKGNEGEGNVMTKGTNHFSQFLESLKLKETKIRNESTNIFSTYIPCTRKEY